jgi:hypothetical protein
MVSKLVELLQNVQELEALPLFSKPFGVVLRGKNKNLP